MPTYKGLWPFVITACLFSSNIYAQTNQVSISTDTQFRYIKSNGIPRTHGQFPNAGNPNAIKAQSYNFRIPLYPNMSTKVTPLQNNMDFGVGIDGVPFDPGTAERWNNNPQWQEEAIVGDIKKLGIDFNNAHVQPTGAYHYHAMPSDLTSALTSTAFSPIIGWAADGFPIYAQYGYLNVGDPEGGIKEMQSSYKLKSGNRPMPPNGPGGVYDGTYTSDYEYIEGRGDLDQCNGAYGPTPDYPNGTYYYFITWEFPRIPRCWRGMPDDSFRKKEIHGAGNHQHMPPPPPPPK